MASEKQLEVLRFGATEWNAWRTQNALVDIDLGGVDLQGSDLRGANLQNGNFRLSNLQGANLRGANLRDSNLLGANLKLTNLEDADLSNVLPRGLHLQVAEQNRCSPDLLEKSGGKIAKASREAFDLWAQTAFDAASKMLGVEVDAAEVLKTLSEHYRATPYKPSPSVTYKSAEGKEVVVHQHPYQQLQQNLFLIALQSITEAQKQSLNALSFTHLGVAMSNLKCLSWPFESLVKKEHLSSANT